MNKYQNGKIYRIWNDTNEEFYIGSTTDVLRKRFYKHKYDSRQDPDAGMKLYQAFRDIGIEHFKIELVELVSCVSKDELLRREGEIIRQLKPQLNIRIPSRTPQEYRIDNKERLSEFFREYYLNNKASKCEYARNDKETQKKEIQDKQAVKIDCECGLNITKHHRARHMKTQLHQKRLLLKSETDCQDED